MRKLSLITFVGILTLGLASCGGESPPAATTSPSPTAASTPATTASPSAGTPAQPLAAKKPSGVAQQQANLPPVPGLVQSTNTDERVKQSQQGRRDPFAIIPVQPLVTASPTSAGAGGSAGTGGGTGTPAALPIPKPVTPLPSVPKPPKGAGLPTVPTVAKNPPKAAPSNTRVPSATAPSAKVPAATAAATAAGTAPAATAPAAFKPELPPVPQPDLARSIQVTGVVQIGGVIQAIVKAPNESFDRYVRVGERLANGQVLVKRIEMNGPTPVVVFEQYGVEVAIAPGEVPKNTPQKPGTTAMLPNLAVAEGS